MEQYRIGRKLEKIEGAAAPGDMVLVLCGIDEWQALFQGKEIPEYLTGRSNDRFCRSQDLENAVMISVSRPVKHHYPRRSKELYSVTRNQIVIAHDSAAFPDVIEGIAAQKKWDKPTVGKALASVVEECVEDDIVYLAELEERLVAIEEELMGNEVKDFPNRIFGIRKELLGYANFYLQMTDVAQELEENESGVFDTASIKVFRLMKEQFERLLQVVQTLREYTLQLRDVHQTQIDTAQNKTMKVLTVVTTIIMPITLVTSWYGMNFRNMPELYWKFGYAFAGALCVAVATLVLIWMKRKKIL